MPKAAYIYAKGSRSTIAFATKTCVKKKKNKNSIQLDIFLPVGRDRRFAANCDSGRFAVGTPSFLFPRPYPRETCP